MSNNKNENQADIEALKARVQELEQALLPFAKMGLAMNGSPQPGHENALLAHHDNTGVSHYVYPADVTRAAELLFPGPDLSVKLTRAQNELIALLREGWSLRITYDRTRIWIQKGIDRKKVPSATFKALMNARMLKFAGAAYPLYKYELAPNA